MSYEQKDFSYLLGLEGFSDQLLNNHFALYQGYVTNCNKLANLLKQKEMEIPEYAELKRRFGWEFDGMRLHELYFGNMAKETKPLDENSELFKKIEENFQKFANWEKDFKATGAMRGIGWVVLYQDGNNLFNIWINEHDMGHLTGAKPLLVMDVFEHAYITDYGLKKADYIDAFFKTIDWPIVSQRFQS